MRIDGVTYVNTKNNKSKKLIKVIFYFVAFIFILIFFIASVSGFSAWKIVNPQKQAIKPFSSNIVLEYKDITFLSGDNNTRLSGWFFEKKGSEKTVILAHDYGKNRLQFDNQTIDIIKALLSNNFNVLAFDFRNCGKSEGSITSICLLEKEDLQGAIKYAKNTGKSKIIILLGFSMGASTSLLAAAENPDVDAVIADSPFADHKSYINNKFTNRKLPTFPFDTTVSIFINLFTGIDVKNIDLGSALVNISPRPILFIHGSEDRIVENAEIRQLDSIYKKAGGSKSEIYEVSNCGHLEAYANSPDLYVDKVVSFIQKYLS